MATSVLFVCSGNVFRSLTAELALKQLLGQATEFTVSSAGTHAKDKPLRTDVIDSLKAHGLDPAGHRPTLLTAEILNQAGLVVVMGAENRKTLIEQFSYEAVYFNQLCHGLDQPVIDLDEAIPNFRSDKEAASRYVRSVIDHIVTSTPKLVAALPRYAKPNLEAQTTEETAEKPKERPLKP